MAERIGIHTIRLTRPPVIRGSAVVGTTKEAQGPLAKELTFVFKDAKAGAKTWEQAESALHGEAIRRALEAADVQPRQVDLLLAGDLLNQCMATTFGARSLHMPLAGVYGACSTMALTLALAGVLTDSGAIRTAVASTSSHFCAAEKQFRMPLEYGGQRPPTAQWTATAAGAAVIGSEGTGPAIEAVCFGRIEDCGVTDSANMGAAMAPAACETIAAFLQDTGTRPQEYDLILTGDLGVVGTRLLLELAQKQHGLYVDSLFAEFSS